MQNVSKFIEDKRKALGWTEDDMAKRTGLSFSEYYDIELHEDELRTVVPLLNVRRLAEAIDAPLHELFDLAPWDDGPVYWKRHEYIAAARDRLGATVSEMGDGVGFHDWFVTSLETHSEILKLYPFEVLWLVATYLKVPPQHLLGRRVP